jgi:hypothetical protein
MIKRCAAIAAAAVTGLALPRIVRATELKS